MRLGLLPARDGEPKLLLADYLTAGTLPTPPDACGWTGAVSSWGEMLNDRLGNCAEATVGHMDLSFQANAGHPIVIPDSDILTAYEQAAGYNPNDPSTDQGSIWTDVLNWWKTTGLAGRKITAWAAVDPKNPSEIKSGVQLLGGTALGIQLPLSAQGQTIWDVPSSGTRRGSGRAGTWGGHAVPALSYAPFGVLVVTWGGLKWATWNFLAAYLTEAYVVVNPDFLTSQGVNPVGLNLAAMQADCALL